MVMIGRRSQQIAHKGDMAAGASATIIQRYPRYLWWLAQNDAVI